AMSAIGSNIANVTTNGFKRSDVRFQSVVGAASPPVATAVSGTGSMASPTALSGVRGSIYHRIADQGDIKTTGGELDIAINGEGFFVFRRGLDGDAATVFGRDGQLRRVAGPPITVGNQNGEELISNRGYLADKNGHFLQGWPVKSDGTFSTDAQSMTSVRVDPLAFEADGSATTALTLAVNLPADDTGGLPRRHGLEFFDGEGARRQLLASFAKSDVNTWSLTMTGGPSEQVTLSPPLPLQFTAGGEINGPANYAVTVAHVDGSISAFNLDLSASTQFAGDYSVHVNRSNGHPPGSLDSVEFDRKGYLIGRFSNGIARPLYRLPIADFANADGLTPLDGNVFAMNAYSGGTTFHPAGEAGVGSLVPGAVEASNVDLADQFTRMIMTQQAYNSSATAFRTLDELLQTTRDLKG
ncbi:MAG: flagellar hook-basal body complex protein, partial [Rhodospirillales bacterium]|nr:flagellar hook-basal body complex protein [Rhodospirillales bacterium]